MPFQKHEGEIGEEGTRLDHGEKGEEEKTGTGGSSRHKIHRTSEKTSFLALTHAAVPSLALVCTTQSLLKLRSVWTQLIFSSLIQVDEMQERNAIMANHFYIWLSVWQFLFDKWW